MTENKTNIPIVTMNTFDDDKNTRLHFAAATGDTDIIWGSLKDGHKIDPVNYLGWTPLMMATRNGHLDAVKMLIEEKADATKKNRFGASVFLMAVTTGNLDIIGIILQHLLCGGVSKQSMESTLPPMVFAVLFGHEHVVQYLYDQSFHINQKTFRTELTSLMFAAVKKDNKLINFLTCRGANINLRNVNNQSAQDILSLKHRRNRRLEASQVPPSSVAMPPPLSPMIFVNQPPCVHLPQRKSSGLMFSPGFAPVSPIDFVQQIFFPMDFNSSGSAGPNFFYPSPNEMLNARISPNVFLSPMMPNNYSFMQSPC